MQKLIGKICSITAILMLCVLFIGNLANTIIKADFIERFSKNKSNILATIEDYFNFPDALSSLLTSIQTPYLKITDRTKVNGVITLKDGRLIQEKISNPPLLDERAEVIIELNRYLENKNIPFLFVRVPNAMRDNSDLPPLVSDTVTVLEDSARFMAMLNDNGVDTLDLRVEMTRDFADYAENFYWGDHHWNVDGALWAYGKTGEYLNNTYGFKLDCKTWNPQEYERISFSKTFVGSMSRRLTREREDIIALHPKFLTNYEVTEKTITENATIGYATGNFVDVFIPKLKNEDNKDFGYADLNSSGGLDTNSIETYVRYINAEEQENKKILLIGDSFAIVFASYLSTAVKQIDYEYLVDDGSTYKDEYRIYQMFNNESYDLVLFLIYDVIILAEGDNIESDRMYLGNPPNGY
ncbi:MAG: hypothetical protein LBR74_03105 [Eubacterium sp.]|jgi:hypothetical protein|nr:hypothetical protein [Eubacterium sp.]